MFTRDQVTSAANVVLELVSLRKQMSEGHGDEKITHRYAEMVAEVAGLTYEEKNQFLHKIKALVRQTEQSQGSTNVPI